MSVAVGPDAPVAAPTPGERARHAHRNGTPVVLVLAVAEGRRLLRHPAFLVGVLLTPALVVLTAGGSAHEWRRLSTDISIVFVPLAWLTLVAANLMALRERRHHTAELIDTAPAPPAARTAALALATLATVPVTVGLLVATVAYESWRFRPIGGQPDAGELAVAVLLVVGGGVVGVAVARWLPSPLAALPAIFVTAWLAGTMSQSMTAPSRWLGFWIDPSPLNLASLDPRPTAWHLVWLAAWVVVMGAVAVSRHGLRRPVVVAAGCALALAAIAGWYQTRPLSRPQIDEMVSVLTSPDAHQTCVAHGEVTYCAYPAYDGAIEPWRAVTEGVLDAVPARARRPLEVRQRIGTVLGNPDCGEELALDLVPPPARARLDPDQVWPLDGGVHPPVVGSERLPCGGASVAWLFTAVQTGAWAVGLPPAPWGLDQRCTADHQARSTVALWLGANAVPDGADHLAAVRRTAPGRGSRLTFTGGWNEHPQWGVHWHLADVDAVLALLGRPAGEVRQLLAERWEEVVAPTTSTSDLLAMAGLRSGARTPASPSTCPALPGG